MASFFFVVNLRHTKGHTIYTALNTKLATSWHECQYFVFKLSTMVYRVHKSTSVGMWMYMKLRMLFIFGIIAENKLVALIRVAFSLYLVLPLSNTARCHDVNFLLLMAPDVVVFQWFLPGLYSFPYSTFTTDSRLAHSVKNRERQGQIKRHTTTEADGRPVYRQMGIQQ